MSGRNFDLCPMCAHGRNSNPPRIIYVAGAEVIQIWRMMSLSSQTLKTSVIISDSDDSVVVVNDAKSIPAEQTSSSSCTTVYLSKFSVNFLYWEYGFLHFACYTQYYRD